MSAIKQKGFNLFEIMVVVVILGLLATFIIPKIAGRPDEARVIKARSDIQTLETALDLYRLDNGTYPSTDQGLEALVERPNGEPIPRNYRDGGYIKRLPPDPWKHPYQYLYPGDNGEFDIFSYGADGKPGGEGVNAEIGNWQS
jgi:general secretion pathway protein G